MKRALHFATKLNSRDIIIIIIIVIIIIIILLLLLLSLWDILLLLSKQVILYAQKSLISCERMRRNSWGRTKL